MPREIFFKDEIQYYQETAVSLIYSYLNTGDCHLSSLHETLQDIANDIKKGISPEQMANTIRQHELIQRVVIKEKSRFIPEIDTEVMQINKVAQAVEYLKQSEKLTNLLRSLNNLFDAVQHESDYLEQHVEQIPQLERDDLYTDWLGKSRLFLSIERQETDLAMRLLKLNLFIDKGRHFAVLLAAAKKGLNSIIEELIVGSYGIDINKGDSQNRTALYFAIENKHESTAQLLINLGAKVGADSRSHFLTKKHSYTLRNRGINMPNKTIVFDFHDTLATVFTEDAATVAREYPWVSILKKYGLYIEDIHPYIIHPGIIELIQCIDAMPNTRMAVFSSGDLEPLNRMVENIFCLALGKTRYDEISKGQFVVCSKKDLTPGVENLNQTQLKQYGPMFLGDDKKNLKKIARSEEELAWTVLIEDDSSYSYYGQEKNLVKTLGASSIDFEEAFTMPKRSSILDRSGTFANIHHIFRLAGVLFAALEITEKEKGITLADALFQVQFKETNQEMKDENTWAVFDEESIWRMDYYALGLEKLKRINPNLCLLNPEALVMHHTSHTASEATPSENACHPWYVDAMFDAIDQKNCIELLKRLKIRGADFNVKNKHGSTLLNHAVLRLPSFNPHLMTDLVRGGYTAERYKDSMKHSLKHLLDSAQTELDEQLTVLDFLLKNGASPRISGVNGKTPLALLLQEINLSHETNTVFQMLDRFIIHHADVNAVDDEGSTPLHKAVRSGNLVVVDYLIKHGAKVDTQCREGWTALHYAAEWGYPLATTLLLKNGANPNKTNKDGLTPSQLTAKAIGLDCNRKVKSKYIEVQEIIAEHISKKQKEEKEDLSTSFSPERNPEKQFQRPQSDACFVERTALFEKICTHFSKPQDQILVLTGLRGIGKSYMAKRYCLAPDKPYNLRAWFNLGPSSESLETQYFKLALEHGLSLPPDASSQDKISWIKNWLEKQTNILLIYDDAPNAESLKGFLPEIGKQHEIIITTCNQLNWTPEQRFKSLPLPVMEEDEALELINKITRYSDEPATKQLIKLMKALPLALAQAGYYMNVKSVSPEGYLQRYLRYQSTLLEYKPTEKIRKEVKIQYESSIAVAVFDKINFEHMPLWYTFDSDLETMKRGCNEAWFLLLRVSWLASHPIPEEIVRRLLNLQEAPDVLWADVKAAIMRFAFMQQMEDGNMCMHPLLQDIIRSKQEPELSKLLLASVTKIIQEEATFGAPLTAHMERLEQHARSLKMVQPSTPFVFKFSPPEEKKSTPAPSVQSSKTSGSFFNTPAIKTKSDLIKDSLAKFNLSEEEQTLYEKILSKNVNYKISDKEGFVLEGTSSFEFKDKELLALGLKPGQWETTKVGFLDNFIYIKPWNQCLGLTQQKPAAPPLKDVRPSFSPPSTLRQDGDVDLNRVKELSLLTEERDVILHMQELGRGTLHPKIGNKLNLLNEAIKQKECALSQAPFHDKEVKTETLAGCGSSSSQTSFSQRLLPRAKSKDEVSTLQKTARAALAAKDYKQAILQYGDLVTEYKSNSQLYTKLTQAVAYFSLGLSHLRLEDWRSAYPYLKQAVELHPDCRLYQMRLKECEDMKNSKENLLGNRTSI